MEKREKYKKRVLSGAGAVFSEAPADSVVWCMGFRDSA
jgi:hypothetical protein